MSSLTREWRAVIANPEVHWVSKKERRCNQYLTLVLDGAIVILESKMYNLHVLVQTTIF